jgi:hypothetical protein
MDPPPHGGQLGNSDAGKFCLTSSCCMGERACHTSLSCVGTFCKMQDSLTSKGYSLYDLTRNINIFFSQ